MTNGSHNARDQKIATMEADNMNDDARDSSASRGSGLRPKRIVDRRIVSQGWRLFDCDECGATFEEPTRDCGSPSGVACECGAWVSPTACREDASLPIDPLTGNLAIKCERVILD